MNAFTWLAAACLLGVGCDRYSGPVGPTPAGGAPVGQSAPELAPIDYSLVYARGLAAALDEVDALVAQVANQADALARESRERLASAKYGIKTERAKMEKARARHVAMRPAGPAQARLPGGPQLQTPPQPAMVGHADWHRTDADDRLNQALRKSFARDESLAAAADDIQLRTSHGRVVLSGVVRSEVIKAELLARARATAGEDQVVDRLEVQ